jgi:Cyclopropane fatty acid synthase and related methyltransferases
MSRLMGMIMLKFADSFVEKRWYDVLSRLQCGSLEFVAPDGSTRIATGPLPGPKARFAIRDWSVLRHIVQRGDIALGEDYIDGAWDTDSIDALIQLFLLNMDALGNLAHGGFFSRMALVISDRFVRRNSLGGAKRNIEAHYDVGNDFYALWLDKSMTYSSALFAGTAPNLETAQSNKYERILERLAGCGKSVLEIGCGWGGFAEKAVAYGREVTGLTISPSQFKFASERLKGAADIQLEDYRKTKGRFDSIVSIEMFEAVGEQYWPAYFRTLAERLKREGRAIVQTITVRDDLFSMYRLRSDFIRHYVFPGGMLPSLQRFREEAEKAGLKVVDQFAFGKDYAKTLREWSARMTLKTPEIKAMGHDDRFLRNWQYYLNICAAAFEVGRTDVVQVELVHA